MHLKFLRDHEYAVDKATGRRRRIPAGWAGMLDEEIARAAIEAGAAVDLAAPSDPAPSDTASEEAKSVAEVLAMADTTHFQTFRAEAVRILGEATPATKAEIVTELKTLAGL